MTEHPRLKHFFLTDPQVGVAVANIQEKDEELQRFELTREQLFALNAKSADILLKGSHK